MTDTNTGAEAQAPAPGTPEYDAAMAAKFRDSNSVVDTSLLAAFGTPDASAAATEAGKPVRPDNVPEKFWDAEKGTIRTDELLKSYTELEKKPAAVEKPAVADPAAAAAAAAEPNAAVQSAVAAAGLDMAALGAKIGRTGDIDEADYVALEKIGFDRETVAGIVAGQAAANVAALQTAYAYGGGEQATNELLQWATTLPDDQKAAYNDMLAGPNWKVALDTLKSLKAAANPASREPSLAAVIPAGGGSGVGYQTEGEMHAAMRDPRYFQMDPVGEAYRREVQQKVQYAAYRRQAGR